MATTVMRSFLNALKMNAETALNALQHSVAEQKSYNHGSKVTIFANRIIAFLLCAQKSACLLGRFSPGCADSVQLCGKENSSASDSGSRLNISCNTESEINAYNVDEEYAEDDFESLED